MATVEKRGNSYSIRVSNKYKKGKQDRKNFTWTPDPGLTEKQEEKELQKQISRYEDLVTNGRFLDGNIKFEDFAEKWLELHAEKQLAPKTIYEYRNQLTRINEAIGHIRLDKLQPAQLIEFYNNLSEKGIRQDTRYSAKDKLIAAAGSAGLNASQLAYKAGLSDTTGQVAFNGQTVSKKSAAAMAEALGFPLSDLFKAIDKKATLSGNSILHYHRLISSILNTAVEWQVIVANPADRARSPRSERKESKYLDEVEAKRIVELLATEPIQYRTMVTLLIFTGLRRGELCGLKWSDINFENSLLHIQRALQYVPEKGLFEKPPKSEKSNRVIKLSSIAVRLLLDHLNAQNLEKISCGDQWQENDLVFPAWNGSYFHPDGLTVWFKSFIERSGLPKATPHTMRHTSATLQIASGVDVRTVSKRLGHAQTSTTTNIYAHAIRSADEAAAEVLEDIFKPGKKLAKKKSKAPPNKPQKAKISGISHK